MKRILAATDLSERASSAVTRASQIAGVHDGRVLLLHVMHPIPEGNWLGKDWVGLDDGKAARDAALHQLKALAGGDAAVDDCQVAEGKPFVEIIRHSRATDADLTVVGAHGAHFVRDLFLGTTAERVVRKSDRPVLVVKQPGDRPYRRVLIATDFSESSRQAVEFAMSLAPEAEFTLLHVYDDWFVLPMRRAGAKDPDIDSAHRQMLEALQPEMDESLKDVRIVERAQRRIIPGYPGTTIVEEARTAAADLVVMGARGHGSVYYALLGSTAEHVMREARCDVLAVRRGQPQLELP